VSVRHLLAIKMSGIEGGLADYLSARIVCGVRRWHCRKLVQPHRFLLGPSD